MYQTFQLEDFSPAHLLATAHYFADYSGTCLLYSGGKIDSARKSFLALFPYEKAKVQNKQLELQCGDQIQIHQVQNPWEALQAKFFDRLDLQSESYTFGYFGYEMGVFSDEDKILPYTSSSTPDAYWQRCALVVIYDHLSLSTSVVLSLHALDHLSDEAKHWMKKLSSPQGWVSFINGLKKEKRRNDPPLFLQSFPNRKDYYLDRIAQAKELIYSGDIYQINLSQTFLFNGSKKPFDIFLQASELNPAPFSAYFHIDDFTIVSTSPERFLQKAGGYLETRPIKGTIQRGQTLEEDQKLKSQLLSSPKEKAELLMITDLMRNDLGKVSEVGSVETLEIWRCEEYSNVFHLVSLIRSLAKKDLKPLEIIRSCFPGGSITGCPKLRAMEIIQALESKPRGVYTGSIGYLTGSGDFDLNIAIRTLIFQNDQVKMQLGGGIVLDSDPEQEYKETLVKGQSLFNVLQNKI